LNTTDSGGKYEEILANPNYLKVMEQGAVTHLPGAEVSNLTLKAPNRLNIMQASSTVEDATNLNLLLKQNMGQMDWAACLQFSPR
jgi:filamentous hemagglutinin